MKAKYLLVIIAILIQQSIKSQTITGKVIDENGKPILGVTVKVYKKEIATTTNVAGIFSIKITTLPETLIFLYVGYQNYKVNITEATLKDKNFEVVLLKLRNELSEVVVVGYGAKSKKDVTGSTSSVESTDYDKSIFAKEIDSRVPGVMITRYPSESIKIRGISSLSNSVVFNNGRKTTFSDSLIADENGKVLKTKLVTAGELNDFNKWKMWEDFTETDFKAHSITWNLFAKKRYCVQLQNNNYGPVVGEQVSLVNKNTKEVIWTALTDNTGKAELWANFNKAPNNIEEEYMIEIKNFENINKPILFEQGINKVKLSTSCAQNNTVDISFVVDATDSMGDEIEFLKLELEDVIKNAFDKFNNLNLRASSVFYRDIGDEYVTKHVDFNSDLLKVLNFIKLQKAAGGGDFPEALDAAVSTALDSLSWSENARTKLMFIILDAPPHAGKEAAIFDLIKKAAAKGVRIIPIVCSDADKSTEFLMRSMALATNGSYVFLTNNSGIGNPHMKPTTDVFNVELLNNLLQRLINQTIYLADCKNGVEEQPIIKLPENVLNVKVSPNPTSGRIVVKSNKPLKEIFICDFTGKMLLRLTGREKQERWEADLSNYPSGTYIVKYITKDNEWGASKLIVVR